MIEDIEFKWKENANTAHYCYSDELVGIDSIIKPELSKWSLKISNFTYTPLKGEEPNWFHRKMQYLILGFKWVKTKE